MAKAKELDPIEELDKAAHRLYAEQKAAERMSLARQQLLIPGKSASADKRAADRFYGSIAMCLDLIPDWGVETACTNGKVILYNPDFINAQARDSQVLGLGVHEVHHPMLKHHVRRGHRDAKKWNIACDLSFNGELKELGYDLPDGALFPGVPPFANVPKGLSAETIYPLIPDFPDGDEGGDDPGGCGGVKDGGGTPSELSRAASEFDMAVSRAAQEAQRRGNLPDSLARLVAQIIHPPADCWEILKQFVTKKAKNEYKWSPPNRRYVAQGIYLPALSGAQLDGVVWAIDTSGSIDNRILGLFEGAASDVGEMYPGKMTIIYCDAQVQRVDQWEPDDGPFKLRPKGGGGTSHKPVFEWIDKNMDEPPTCLICLTDMYTEFPDKAPPYPVLWASTTKGMKAPFGDYVEVS